MRLQMTIGRKLFSSFGAELALTLLISLVALQSFSGLDEQVRKLADSNARKVYLAADINMAISDVSAAERGILLRAYMQDNATVETYKSQPSGVLTRLN